MGAWLDRNLEVLARVNPALARRVRSVRVGEGYQVLPAKNGLPVLRAGKTTLHSVYDPVREGEHWARVQEPPLEDAPAVAVLGFGMGYHLPGILKKTGRPLWVIEPNLEILRTAMEESDLRELLSRVLVATGREEAVMRALRENRAVTLVHEPSRNLSPSRYDAIRGRIRLWGLKKLKILVVYPIYGGSLPIADYCSRALRELGHHVEEMSYGNAAQLYTALDMVTTHKENEAALKGQFTRLLSEMALARCLEVKPDLVLALAQAPLLPETLGKIREIGVPLVYWFVEDFRLMEYWKEIAPLCDLFLTIQKGEFLDAIGALGVGHAHYLPTAALPEIHRPLTLCPEELREYGSDLSFVGAGYYNRQQFFQGLLGMEFKIWGSDWNFASPLGRCLQRRGKRVSTEDSVKIFNATRINLNLHSSTYHRGVNPEGDFVNPRTFEIAACGRFQLVDERAELPDLFEPNLETCTFRDLEELREKTGYYLNHFEEAERIAGSARERVLSEHTYASRMEEMLGLMFERGFRGRGDDGEPVEELIARAGAHTELGTYLSGFQDRKNLRLEDIVSQIHRSQGRLSEQEAMFLLMKELAGNP